MFPVFTLTGALFGLVAVPALVAIYWLRNRYRRVPVSSLMLWLDQLEAREGGARVQRLQAPLLMFLELAAVILLVLAAAQPHLPTALSRRPLIVVLDDSYSMLAGGDDSPRSQALVALRQEIGDGRHSSVRFLRAGRRPQLLGEPVTTAAEALDLLKQWTCRAPAADLDKALALAAELGGERARLLVVSDRAPVAEPAEGTIQWWAFGRPRPNVAFVNAARSAGAGRERCLLEIANLSDTPQETALTVEGDSTGAQRTTLALRPREVRRLVFDMREGASEIEARLADDALAMDNRVTLRPEARPPVRVTVRITDAALRGLVENAVSAAGGTVRNAARPDLLFTDAETEAAADAETWSVYFLSEKSAESYVGPFVIDRGHPLTEGLSLRGAVWGAGKTQSLPGLPIILAGNVPLLSDSENLTGRHELRLRLRPDLSTVQDSPDWPVLIANLIQWRAAHLPGLSRANVRLGDETTLTLARADETVRLTAPDGSARSVTVPGRRLVVPAEDVGRYELHAADDRYAFAANALNADESDLSRAASGRWGNWLPPTAIARDYQNVAWVFVLLALVVLTLHLAVAARGARRARP